MLHDVQSGPSAICTRSMRTWRQLVSRMPSRAAAISASPILSDARITIDFGALDAGFLLPAEAAPVWAGDIDRLFVSLVPPGY